LNESSETFIQSTGIETPSRTECTPPDGPVRSQSRRWRYDLEANELEVIGVSSDTLNWIKTIVEELDKRTDRETCEGILEACGRRCAPAADTPRRLRIQPLSSC
jgi:hypothetical protein